VTKDDEKMVIRPSLSCQSGGYQLEDFRKEIFSGLPFPAGTALKSKRFQKKTFLQSILASSYVVFPQERYEKR
jgi:hypothetical protein